MRTATTRPQIRPSVPRYSPGPHVYLRRSTSNRVCPFCKHAGRSNFHHFLSECTHLPEEDRRYMAKVRQVINLLDDEDEQNSPEPEVSNTEVVDSEHPVVQNIEVRQSPRFCRHHTTRVTVDSGATGNMIRHSTAHELGCVIEKSSQSDHQADGSSPLSIVGETSISLTRDNWSLITSTSKSLLAHPSWRQMTLPYALSNTSSHCPAAPPTPMDQHTHR